MSFTIKSLQGLSIRQIADVFNDAFSDYVIPIKLTEEILTAKILSENIQLENSVGVFDNDKLIAFILIGIDEYDGHIVAYNAGTGVIPSYRGNKLTKRMYQYLFPLLKDKDIVSHQLEVITTNTKALNVYEQIGFVIKRSLCCFRGIVKSVEINPAFTFNIVPGLNVINHSSFNSIPSYQNSSNCIQREINNHVFVEALFNGRQVGFLVFSPANARIKLFAIEKVFRKIGIGHSLFYFMQNQCAGKEISIINIDASDDETVGFLEHIGLKPTVEQFEMTFSIQT